MILEVFSNPMVLSKLMWNGQHKSPKEKISDHQEFFALKANNLLT